jgi:hypothetical protein
VHQRSGRSRLQEESGNGGSTGEAEGAADAGSNVPHGPTGGVPHVPSSSKGVATGTASVSPATSGVDNGGHAGGDGNHAVGDHGGASRGSGSAGGAGAPTAPPVVSPTFPPAARELPLALPLFPPPPPPLPSLKAGEEVAGETEAVPVATPLLLEGTWGTPPVGPLRRCCRRCRFLPVNDFFRVSDALLYLVGSIGSNPGVVPVSNWSGCGNGGSTGEAEGAAEGGATVEGRGGGGGGNRGSAGSLMHCYT